jgi:hypothetical protein
MDSFDDKSFEKLLADSQLQEQAAQRLEEVQLRLKPFLEERGIIFDDPEDDTGWYWDDESLNAVISQRLEAKMAELGRELTPEEAQEVAESITEEALSLMNARALRYNNRSQLRALAGVIAMVEEAGGEEGGHNLDPNFKKKLQAQYVVRGSDKAWVEVIDRDLPGEALSEEDTGLIAEVAIQDISTEQEGQEWLDNQKAQFRDFLYQHGVDEITAEGEITITILCSLYHSALTIQRMRQEAHLVRFAEDAKIVLVNHGQTEEAWNNLVDTFFTMF